MSEPNKKTQETEADLPEQDPSGINGGLEAEPSLEPDQGLGAAADPDDGLNIFTEGEIDALREERDQMKDRLLRAMAEAENIRKRGERDRREAESYGGTRLARDLLPVYDNLKRALDAMTEAEREAAKGIVDGIGLTLRELTNVLARHGVKAVSPKVGDVFDPKLHEAMFEAPIASVPAGNIIQVMGEGFMIHERLLRPAQVGVSSTSAAATAAQAAAEKVPDEKATTK